MDRTRHSINNSFWGVFYRVLHMIGPMLLRRLIIYRIGAAYIGLSSVCVSIFQVLNLTELGFASAAVYMMYKPIAENDTATVRRLLTLMRTIYRVVGLVILIAGLAVLPFLHVFVKDDVKVDGNYWLVYVMFLFHAVMTYWMFSYEGSIFTSHQRTEVNFQICSVIILVQYIGQYLAIVYTENYYWYMLVYALLIIPQNLMTHFRARRQYPDIYCEGKPTAEEKQALITKIKSLFGHRLGNTFIFSIDSIIISSNLGLDTMAHYDNYSHLLASVCQLMGVLRTSILASVGNKLVLDTEENNYALFKRLNFLWIGFAGMCAACFAGLYQPFIALWVGEDFLFQSPLVVCLVMYFFTRELRMIPLVFKDAAGLWEADKWKPYIGIVLNTVTSFAFVRLVYKLTGNSEWALMGVLIPTMVILVGVFIPWETHVLFTRLFHRSVKEYLGLIIRFALTSLVGVFAVFFICKAVPLTGVLALIVNGAISVSVSGGVYLLLNANTQQFKISLRLGKKMARRTIKKLTGGRP